MPLIAQFREAARRYPRKPAIVCCGREITYAELDRDVSGIARWFLTQGLQPGDRVAVHGTNTIQTAQLLLACFQAGLIAVPLNVRLKPAELAFMLGHAQPKLCFTEPALAPLVNEARAQIEAPPPVFMDVPPALEGVELPAPSPDAPALILYTSGTTARPKGVTHTHASLAGSVSTMLPTGIDETSILLVSVPFMHASGMMCCLLPALSAGATMVLVPVFDPAAVLDAIERHRCTWGIGLPAMMQFVTKEQQERPRDVSSLRTWIAGGDSVPIALLESFARAFGIPLQEGHAMSESVAIAWNRPGAVRNGTIGPPADGVEIRVLDLIGRPVEDGSIGELAVRSPSMFHSYWLDPASTQAALVDGWLLTGDLVRRDSDGYFWFQGRRKEVIIRGGSNISPQEVEEALYRHPAVMETGVVGIPDAVYGECPVACVSLRPGKSATEAELQDFVRRDLADYKVPTRIVFLSELPKGITGKVQRRALKEITST